MVTESSRQKNWRTFSALQVLLVQGDVLNLLILTSGKLFFSEEVDHFFSTIDTDFDGRLSLEEIMGEDTSVEKLFKIMDKNGDGFVTKKVSGQGI